MALLRTAASLAFLLLPSRTGWADTNDLLVCTQDVAGRSIVGASVSVLGTNSPSSIAATTDDTGCASLHIDRPAAPAIAATAKGFASASSPWSGQQVLTLILQSEATAQQVEVTAARTPLPLEATASSVRTLSAKQLDESPGLNLDDRLREVAGFQLFRRTSSQVANPTTEGTSLRGLGSTAASRTLVLSDQIPLNDGFGGWIHWNETPQLAIQSVDLVRGGASDLYGSSAIGGVIDLQPVTPSERVLAADLAGATEDTFALSGLTTETLRRWGLLAASTITKSNGYILTAPAIRGAVDVASTVRSQSGRFEATRSAGKGIAAFLSGNLLNEVRGNGTPLQTNATRLWRYAIGLDAPSLAGNRFFVRAYGDDQGYRQSFSSIASTRATELLTRLQRSPSQQLGGAVQWARAIHAVTFVAGADLLDTRGLDDEIPVSKGVDQALMSTTARQRDAGGYSELLWQPIGTRPWNSGWSMALSGRVDRFHDFDAQQFGGTIPGPLPGTDETVFNPRLGLVKQLNGRFSVTGSIFRAFRGPTMNELYRTGQVGQQTTQANPSLRSERATGFEFGSLFSPGIHGSLRTSYFWTQVNRPVAAVTLSTTATTVLLQRQNLGQLESRGVTAEWTSRLGPWISVTGGYQFALSTVTRFQADPTIVGKWTAQVPRNTATSQLRLERRRWGILSLDALISGKQFDDSANVYELHGYTQFNAYAEHAFTERIRIYASASNLLDRSIDAGRTPTQTLASPRTAMAGIRLRH